MKKVSKSMLAIFVFCFLFSLFLCVNVFASSSAVEEDFNSMTTGVAPTGWTITAPTNTSTTVANVPSSTDKSMYLYDNTTNSSTTATKTFSSISNTFNLSFKFMLPTTGKRSWFNVCEGSNEVIKLVSFNTGKLQYLNSSSAYIDIANISNNVWYTVLLIINPATDTYDIYLDGTLTLSDVPFKTAATSIDNLKFVSSYSYTDQIYIDNVIVDQNEFHVSTAANASDNNPGTVNLPFATISKAKSHIKMYNQKMDSDITVYLHSGVYNQTSELAFTKQDSGFNNYNVIYKAYDTDNVTISGGSKVLNWTQQGNYWVASYSNSQNKYFRQLYVNGITKQRAMTDMPIKIQDFYYNGDNEKQGLIVNSNELSSYTNVSDMYVQLVCDWKYHLFPVEAIEDLGNGSTRIILEHDTAVSGLADLGSEIQRKSFFYLENDISLLSKPGEWYYDKANSLLYYYPESGETINVTEIYAPQIEKIITAFGNSPSDKITNIKFENLTFAYTTWYQPNDVGFTQANGTWLWYTHQMEVPIVDYTPGDTSYANWAVVPAAIQMNYANKIDFVGNTFRNLGAVALGGYEGYVSSAITGNVFYSLGNAAIHLGYTKHNEVDKPNEETCKYLDIKNNVFREIGVTDWGAPAIQTGFVSNVTIDHNDFKYIAYCGVRLGATLTKYPNATTAHHNLITNNRLEQTLSKARDGGAIYTQARSSNTTTSNTTISGNYIVNDISSWGNIYLDAGSAYYTVENNVIDDSVKSYEAGCTTFKWLLINNSIDRSKNNIIKNNYTNNPQYYDIGTNTTYENNTTYTGSSYPAGAITIINSAGLETSYSGLLSKIPTIIDQRNVFDASKITVNAGNDFTVSDYTYEATLTPTYSYSTIFNRLIYSNWTKVSGPGKVSFPENSHGQTKVVFELPGTYVLRLNVGTAAYIYTPSFMIETGFAYDDVTIKVNGITQTAINLAIGKPATSSSDYSTSYAKECAVDNIENSTWVAGSTPNIAWLAVDLQREKIIKRVQIVSRQNIYNSNSPRRNFEVQASNDSSFTTYTVLGTQPEYGFTPFGNWIKHIDNATQFRYVRVIKTVAETFDFAELQIFVNPSAVEDDFNSMTTGVAPTNWTITAPTNTSTTVANVPSSTDKSMYLYDNTTNSSTTATKTFSLISNTFNLSFKFMLPTTGKRSYFKVCEGTTDVISLVSYNTGKLQYLNSSGAFIEIANISNNTWYTVLLIINPVTDKYDIYLDGTLTLSDVPFKTAATSIDSLKFASSYNFTDQVYIDNVIVNYEITPFVIGMPTYDKKTGAVEVTITNNYLYSQTATVIVAQYNVTEGKYYLEDAIQTQSSSLTPGNNAISKTFTPSLNPATTFVKVFLWDSLTIMKPLANVVQSQ